MSKDKYFEVPEPQHTVTPIHYPIASMRWQQMLGAIWDIFFFYFSYTFKVYIILFKYEYGQSVLGDLLIFPLLNLVQYFTDRRLLTNDCSLFL